MVCNKSSAGNYHFRNLQTSANDVRRAKKAYFLTATTLAGPSIKYGVWVATFLKSNETHRNLSKKHVQQGCIIGMPHTNSAHKVGLIYLCTFLYLSLIIVLFQLEVVKPLTQTRPIQVMQS